MNQNCEEDKQRMLGFDLLRVISAMMIVCMHSIGHGGLGQVAEEPGSAVWYTVWGSFMLSRVFTNCFVMISGYFLSCSRIKPGKLFRLSVQILTYSVLTYFLACIGRQQAFSINSLIHAATPISTYVYWFASCYIMLYLAAPLLNIIVHALNKKQFQVMLVVLFAVFSVWPTVCYWSRHTFVNNGYSYIWFFVLYFTAAYIRRFNVVCRSVPKCILLYAACSVLSTVIRAVIAKRWPDKVNLINVMGGYNTPWIFAGSISVFLLFQRVEIHSDWMKKAIQFAAPAAFGIYLLHDSDFSRVLLWKIADLPKWSSMLSPVICMIAATIIITIIGILIDSIYRTAYRLLKLNRIEERLNGISRRFEDRLTAAADREK